MDVKIVAPQSSRLKLSVVLATLGKDLVSLERSLKSVKDQLFVTEVIVIFQKPETKLMELCERYGVSAFEETTKSLGAARNLGVTKANGDLIAFTDDDCELPNDWAGKILRIFQEDPTLACLGGPDLCPPRNKSVFKSILSSFEASRRQNLAFDHSAVNKIKGANVVYKKCVFDNVGYLNSKLKYGEDLEFHIRMVEAGYHLRFDPADIVWHHQKTDFGSSLVHQIKASSGVVPLFLSRKVLSYSKYETLIASYYLTIFLPFIALPIFLVTQNPVQTVFTMLGIAAFLITVYTLYTVNRARIRSLKEIALMPFMIIETTFARLLGFYIGLINCLCSFLRQNKSK